MVGSTLNSVTYAGNASTATAYTIPFRYDSVSAIVVTVTDDAGVTTTLEQGTDYTLSGSGAASAGAFTTATAYPSTSTITVWRETAGLQTLSLPANTPLPAPSLEAQLDRLAMATIDRPTLREVDARFAEVTQGPAGPAGVTTTEGVLAALQGTLWLPNLAALRALDSSLFTAGDVINVRNHTSTADIGGGAFIWDTEFSGVNDPSVSAAPTINVFDDDGTFIQPDDILIPATTPGRWRRAEALEMGTGRVKVRWWGAVPYQTGYYGPPSELPDDVFDSIDAFDAAMRALPLGHPDYVTDTGKRWRIGTILIDVGEYWLSRTWYVSPRCRVAGGGVGKTILIRLPNTAAYADGEKWVVKGEDLTINIGNNNFNNVIEDLSISGHSFVWVGGSSEHENGNGGISGLHWWGAQGSAIRNVHVYSCGMRGLLNDIAACPMQNVWVADVTRGPGLEHTSGGGTGWFHSNLSIEHVNMDGLYMMSAPYPTDLPIPATFIRGMYQMQIISLQGELSSLELFMWDCIECFIQNFSCGGELAVEQWGIYIDNNSYRNKFGTLAIPAAYDNKFTDASDLAVINGFDGVIDPDGLVPGTYMYRRVEDVASNAAKIGLWPGSIHSGQIIRVTGEGDRLERFVGTGTQNNDPDYWEVVSAGTTGDLEGNSITLDTYARAAQLVIREGALYGVEIAPGVPAQSGFVSWFNGSGDRLGFMGADDDADNQISITLEEATKFKVLGDVESTTLFTAPIFKTAVTALGTVSTTATITITGGSTVTAKLTASTACTFTMPTAAAGLSFVLHLKQAATTGNGTATFTGVVWSGGTAPTITATAGTMDILTFIAGPNAAGTGYQWYGSAIQNLTPT